MSSLLVPGFADPDLRPVGDWHPSRYTLSLTGTEDFCTDADRLLPVLAKHWRVAGVARFLADPWMVWLIRHMLEIYPPDWPVVHLRGQLRFRQVVISMGRQNGKSVLAAIIALYLLTMHKSAPKVGGFASSDRQAKIVYKRLKYVIDEDPILRRDIKTTATRGISLKSPRTGIYETLPADEDAIQGEPFTGVLYDELHIGLAALWDAIINGQKAQANSLLCGITTAGDDDSALLIRLYAEGEAAIDGLDERFGFFCWEAEDDTLTEANVIRANPAIACGRVDLETTMQHARKMWVAPADETGVLGRDRAIRYTLNRFVQGSATSWTSLAAWNAGGPREISHDDAGEVIYAVDRTPSQEWATITATSKQNGRLKTHIVATMPDATDDRLLDACTRLAVRPCAFAVDHSTLAALADALRERGHDVHDLTSGDTQVARETAAAAISKRIVDHPADPLTRLQLPTSKPRRTSEGMRISRTLSTGEIDAVLATVWGIYVASIRPERVTQLFGF